MLDWLRRGWSGRSGSRSDPARRSPRSDLGSLAPQPQEPITAARVFVASLGNSFMREIAETVVYGLRGNDVSAELVVDAAPSAAPPQSLLQLVVAPHEFHPLFLDRAFDPERVRSLSRAVSFLATEQPGSEFFEIAFPLVRQGLGAFDINGTAVREFARRGVPATWVHLGISPVWIAAGDHDGNRPIDLLFVGVSTPRRDAFLARHAELFHDAEAGIYLSRDTRPSSGKTPGFVDGDERNRLVASSKILINVHAREGPYFEWHRALLAAANGCLFVSETSDDTEPLVPGEHFVMGDLEELPGLARRWLENEGERRRLTANARQLVTTALDSRITCRQLLSRPRASISDAGDAGDASETGESKGMR
jgi:hypothetical protein